MRFACPLLLGLLSASVLAQSGSGVGKIEKDETIEFTSRGGVAGTMRGRIGQHFSPAYSAGLARVLTFEFTSQDQDASTPQTIVFEVRRQDPTTNFPDWPALVPPLYSIPVTHPAGSGLMAFHWTITPAGGMPLPGRGSQPCYLVWDLPISPGWTSDGVSIHMGMGPSAFPCGTPGNPPCCGSAANPGLSGAEFPRPPITENLAPTDTAAGPLAFATPERSYSHWIVYDSPTLQGLSWDPGIPPVRFCPVNNPNGGFAAMHPDVNDAAATGRNDDIGWRIRAGDKFQNGIAVLFTTSVVLPAPLATPYGDLWVDPLDPFFTILTMGPVPLNAAGTGDFRLTLGPAGAPARAAVAGFGNMHTQAAVIDATLGSIALTNLATKGFAMNGSTPFRVNAGVPVTFPMGNARNVQVQNDGNGDVTVGFLRNGTPLGSFTVLERTRGGTGGLTPVPPGTTDIRISSLNANVTYPTVGTWRLL